MPRFNFTIQDSSPLISYTNGLWVEGDPALDSAEPLYNQGFKATNQSNTKSSFNFLGTGLTIFGATRPNHGNYSVELDGENQGSRNGNGNAFQVDLWHAYGLTYRTHAVELTNQPTNTGPYVDVDFISIERQIGNDGDSIFRTSINDTDAAVKYSGSWSPQLTLGVDNENRTSHTTTTPNSQVNITFHGCCVELYGLYANAAYTVGLDGGPEIRMQGLDVDLPDRLWRPQTLLYLVDGLSEDRHTVSLTTANANPARPFYFDFAVAGSTESPTQTLTDSHKARLNSRTGIAIGLSIGIAALLGLVIAVYLLRRRKRPVPLTRDELMAQPDPYNLTRPLAPPTSLQHSSASQNYTSSLPSSSGSTIPSRKEVRRPRNHTQESTEAPPAYFTGSETT